MASRSARKRDTPRDYWKHRQTPLHLGADVFALDLIPQHGRPVEIGDEATSFQWEDQTAGLTGSAALTVSPHHPKINESAKIRCRWAPSPGSELSRLWTLRVDSPEFDPVTDAWSVTLATTLNQARKSRDDYHFKVDHAHPNGWTCDQIARAVGRKVHLPLGRIAAGTHRIKNLVQKDADPVDVIVKAYRMERVATGRRFFMRWDGAMNIVPLTRSPNLLELGGALIDASYKATQSDTFATVLTVRASAKRKGSKHRRRKIHVRVQSDAGLRRYGYVHRTVTAPSAHTEAEARKWGRGQLAKIMRVKQELTVTTPIMPMLRRGAAFKINWASEGLTQIVFVSGATHSVAPGAATTEVTATFDDPYVDTKADKAAKARADKARKRGRSSDSSDAPDKPSGRRSKRRGGS